VRPVGAGLWGFLIPICIYLTGCGCSFPLTGVLSVEDHPNEAGTASSILGAASFGIAGALTPVVGVLGVGNAVPLGFVMGAAGLVGLLALFLVVRPRSVAPLSR